MIYHIKLPVFEGPLDLLLHLINKAELDIYDIPLAVVTEQYLNYLINMQQLDLDIASEFLIMAATLMSIKARMLLPSITVEKDDEIAEDLVELKEELAFRLLEYKVFKSAASRLQEKELIQSRLLTRPIEVHKTAKTLFEFNPLEGVSLDDLSRNLSELLRKAKEKEKIHEIYRQEVTISQQIEYIFSYLNANPQGVSFLELFHGSSTRQIVIVTFLAILELIRQQKIYAFQKTLFGEIRIYSSWMPSYDEFGFRKSAEES